MLVSLHNICKQTWPNLKRSRYHIVAIHSLIPGLVWLITSLFALIINAEPRSRWDARGINAASQRFPEPCAKARISVRRDTEEVKGGLLSSRGRWGSVRECEGGSLTGWRHNSVGKTSQHNLRPLTTSKEDFNGPFLFVVTGRQKKGAPSYS